MKEKLTIRSSEICGIRTPAEFYQKKFIHKPVQRDYFDIGTAAHAYILEPEKFNELILVADTPPEPEKTNKDGSLTKTGANGKYLQELKDNNPNCIVFEPYIYEQVINYAESIKSIPGFDKLISPSGLFEHHMECECDNVIMTGRADYIKPGKFICDLKFTNKITDFEIQRMFADYEYHVRAAWYLDLWNALNEEKIDTFIYIMVEKSENPVARFIKMSELDINAGRSIYETRIESIVRCHNSGEWILDSIENFQIADWVYNRNLNSF